MCVPSISEQPERKFFSGDSPVVCACLYACARMLPVLYACALLVVVPVLTTRGCEALAAQTVDPLCICVQCVYLVVVFPVDGERWELAFCGGLGP